jgi:hypothetical protein
VRGQGEPLPGGRATKLISCSALSQAAHCQAAAELDGMLMLLRRAVLGWGRGLRYMWGRCVPSVGLQAAVAEL